MKRIAGIVMVALAGCAANPSSDDTGPAARCTVTDCFNQSSIRSFEVLDDRTAVVYVGPQRCPFVVEVDGFNCQLSFSPELRFFKPLYGSTRATETTGQICGSRDTLYVYTGVADPALTEGIGPLEGPPSTDTLGRRRDTFGDRLGSSRSPTSGIADVTVDTVNNNEVCRVSDIRSITDDQLIELRVKQGAPPPPPVGQGQIQVPAGGNAQGQAPGGAAGQSSGEADGQPSGEADGQPQSGEENGQPSSEAGGPPASSETDRPTQQSE